MTGHTSYTPPAAARVTLSGRRQTPCRNQQPEPLWRLAWAVCVGMRMHGPEGGGAQQCAPPTRHISPWPGGWDGDRGEGLLVTAPERGLAAWGTAVGSAAGRGEVPLADRAGHRRGIVPRRHDGRFLAPRRLVGVQLDHQAAASALR